MKGETNLKIQVSLFGDYSNITPTEEIIKNCISAFFQHGMLPSGNVQEMDPNTNRLEPRLSLQSMRNGVSVNFLSNRIDFLVMPVPNSPGAAVTSELFFDQVNQITSSLTTVLGITFNRIGFVSEKFLAPMSTEKLEELRKKFITEAFTLFPDKSVTEWNVRNVVADHFDKNIDQEVNVIYNISKVKVQFGDSNGVREFETLHLTTDINTPLEKRVTASLATLSDFLQQSLDRERAIYKGLTAVAYD
ncbi:hypothetical protein [Pseudomonas sp. IT-P260]|uniref:hypothetical protein n=1 Tax=Pseudomonas sp. IT-P260 TaxID=3026457 RepID=UPI0039E13876